MNWIRLVFRNLWFHRKPYLAVLAGVTVSTAVITGALIVGDSVRYSLHRQTGLRLGKIKYALQANDRYFSQELAGNISKRLKILVAPALQSGGIAINSDKNLRVNRVQVIGIDNRFAGFWERPVSMPGTDEALVSRNVAEKLNLKPGDDLLLRIEKKGKAPSNAPFVSEKFPSVSLRVKVCAVADDHQSGRFSLKNDQTSPYTIFLSLHQLASLLELSGDANLLLATANGSREFSSAELDSVLKLGMEPADAGLHFKHHPVGVHHPDGVQDPVRVVEITSDRIFFDDSTAHAVLSAIPGCNPVMTYLVNSISAGTQSTPYSFVTAASDSYLKQPLGDKEVIASDWLAKDLGVKAGDSVMLRYFLMGPMRSLREDSSRFIIKSVIPVKDGLFDLALMPDFPGMSGAGNCHDWETGAPINLKKIRDKDEKYWKDYRGTPKAFISLDAGRKLWSNRFGSYTAFRFGAREADISGIERQVMSKINPARFGLSFRPVHEEGVLAAGNSTDFGELFLSLSFFILLSAVLLTAMLFSLMAGMRMAETGILSAIGFRKRSILGILSGEAVIMTIAGAIIGSSGGILYNYGLIRGLNTIWQDAVNTSLLETKINATTLLAGAFSGMIISLTVLFFTLRKNLREPLSVLVKRDTGAGVPGHGKFIFVRSMILALLSIGVALSLTIWLMVAGNDRHGSLPLAAGGLLLLGGLVLMNLFLAKWSIQPGDLIPGFWHLILRTLSLHRSPTMMAVALLSLGTFTIVITGANRKTFYGNETARSSGTGGFLLWTESVLPILDDLNSVHGAVVFGLQDEALLKQVRYIQLPGLDGDDASCLNLNQVSRPGLLGIPVEKFNRLNVFSFTNLDPSVDPAYPWKALSTLPAPDVINGFADQTVIAWGLRKSIGDTLYYRDEDGKVLKIKLAGGLDNSIFQGNILVSDSLLQIFYPSVAGSRIMLIDGPVIQRDTIASRLETLFRDYGLMATPAGARLASFNAVENTYLSVFMLLGGLGVMIGTIGLGIVLLRNLSRRRPELTLYLALGFRRKFVFKLLLAEHALILFPGLMLGLISAIPVILPLLVSPVGTVPWLFMSGIVFLILVNGLLWIYFPARAMMTMNPVNGLRSE